MSLDQDTQQTSHEQQTLGPASRMDSWTCKHELPRLARAAERRAWEIEAQSEKQHGSDVPNSRKTLERKMECLRAWTTAQVTAYESSNWDKTPQTTKCPEPSTPSKSARITHDSTQLRDVIVKAGQTGEAGFVLAGGIGEDEGE